MTGGRKGSRQSARPGLAWLVILCAALVAACARGPAGPADQPPVVGEGDAYQESLAATADPESSEPYFPDRRDYAAFASAHPELLEPNYLPFMVHRIPGTPVVGDNLVFCRWPAERMPLAVYIRHPAIPDSLQDEFHPVDAARYPEAVSRALDVWQAELEGLVRFRLVSEAGKADLEVRLRAEVAPIDHDRVVLGTTTALLKACQAKGWDRDSERLVVRFDVPELEIFLADQHGLLMPEQVAAVALHELGHALGMFGHSPIPTDLMYRVVRDRPMAESLSTLDVNSFVSLYRLPNGSHYAVVPPGGQPERPPPAPPSGEPILAGAPHVDTRFGFELRAPHGWLRIETPHGLFTANGPLWDYDASMELIVRPAASIESFLDRYSEALFAGAWLRSRSPLVVNGRKALRIDFEDESGARAEALTFVELDDERLLVIHTQCPAALADAWHSWFHASLASLRIWTRPGQSATVQDAATGGPR